MVVSYVRSEDTLPKLIEILEHQDFPRSRYEIILINGDDFTPRVSEPDGQILGIEKARGKVILLTNSDRYPPLDWISKHMDWYLYHPSWIKDEIWRERIEGPDVVFGPVEEHPVFSVEDLNFGNFSAKREVFETIQIRYIPSQHDVDFAYRLMKTGLKVKIDRSIIVREGDPWDHRHWYMAARNHMILRRRYKVLPPISELRQIHSPWSLIGSVVGLFAKEVKDGHVDSR